MKSDKPTQIQHIWWIKPNTLIGLALLPLYSLIGLITNNLGDFNYWLSFILILCLYLGAQTAATKKTKISTAVKFQKKRSENILNILFLVSLLGYFFWFFELIKNPALLFKALSNEGQVFTLRGVIETTPGLSTLSQLSVVYSAVYIKLITSDSIKAKGKYLYFFMTLLAMTLFRSWVWNERLALIEFLCPAIVIYLTTKNTSRKSNSRLRLFPVVGVFAIYAIFSLFEYFRSWQFYSKSESDFFSFTLKRLTNYYSSAVENGIGFISWQTTPSYDGSLFFGFIYQLPLIGEILRSAIYKSKTFASYLQCCADPEFNLASWPFLIASDIGVPLSMIFFYCMGLIFSTAYKNFISSKRAFVFYPIIYVALLELLRQHYLHSPRFFYIFVGALLVYSFIKIKPTQTQEHSAPTVVTT